jgi:hypothetical protein
MAIGTTNIGLSTIQTEYGGSNPISLSEYYRGGSYVLAHPNNTGIAASGAIRVGAFFNQSKRWIVTVTISATTANFNLRAFLNATYGDYSSIPTDVTVTINSGVYLYASSTALAGFDTGSAWAATSTITVINNGYIIGMGGAGGVGYNGAGEAGGPAMIIRYPTIVNNTNGYILGGGGGGGGGGGMFYTPNGAYYASGGGGGGGQSYQTSAGGANIYGENLSSIIPDKSPPTFTITQVAQAGSVGTTGGGGAGGVGYQARVPVGKASYQYSTAGTGGTGGAWGTAGNNGGVADNGGNADITANGFGVGGAGGAAAILTGAGTISIISGFNSNQVRGFSGSLSPVYTAPGTYNITIPPGVTSMTCTVIGAGGGGGGLWNLGDAYSGAGAGSGGYYINQVVSVTPGSVLTITVGAGGLGGSGLATGFWYPCSGLGATFNGQNGGTSSIGSLLVATGGAGAGHPLQGGPYGSGGTPNGVAGAYAVVNCLAALYGGNNGTGYGKGGDGGNCVNTGYCAAGGGNGFISIAW